MDQFIINLVKIAGLLTLLTCCAGFCCWAGHNVIKYRLDFYYAVLLNSMRLMRKEKASPEDVLGFAQIAKDKANELIEQKKSHK